MSTATALSNHGWIFMHATISPGHSYLQQRVQRPLRMLHLFLVFHSTSTLEPASTYITGSPTSLMSNTTQQVSLVLTTRPISAHMLVIFLSKYAPMTTRSLVFSCVMFDVSPPSPIRLSLLDNYGLMKELTHASATLVNSSVAKAFVIHLSQPTRTCSCGVWQLGLDTHLPLSDLLKLLLTICTHHRLMTHQLK